MFTGMRGALCTVCNYFHTARKYSPHGPPHASCITLRLLTPSFTLALALASILALSPTMALALALAVTLASNLP